MPLGLTPIIVSYTIQVKLHSRIVACGNEWGGAQQAWCSFFFSCKYETYYLFLFSSGNTCSLQTHFTRVGHAKTNTTLTGIRTVKMNQLRLYLPSIASILITFFGILENCCNIISEEIIMCLVPCIRKCFYVYRFVTDYLSLTKKILLAQYLDNRVDDSFLSPQKKSCSYAYNI